MKNNLIFTEIEIEMLNTFLEIYKHSGCFVLKRELTLNLIDSCLTKLSALSVLTVFTKQEFTVMCLAVDYAISNQDELGFVVKGIVHQLFDKVSKFAE